MHDLLFEIEKADEVQVEALLDAVLKRYSQLFPDWEISTISLQKGPDRKDQLDRIILHLENLKASQK